MQKIFIVDGYNLIFRSFYAVPELKGPNGVDINAVFGFLKMLLKIISMKPNKIAIALDTGGRTFRDDIFDSFLEKKFINEIYKKYFTRFQNKGISLCDLNTKSFDTICRKLGVVGSVENFANENGLESTKVLAILIFLDLVDKVEISQYSSQYKANRVATPDALRTQFKIIHELIDAMGITKLSVPNYEADDVIASVAKKAKEQGGCELTIFSSDKDLCQLVCGGTVLYDLSKKKYVDTDGVIEKFGVRPEYVRTFLALVGDKSDNVPGVFGVGPKAACDLINDFGTFWNIMSNVDNIKSEKVRNLLKQQDGIELAELSYKLVGLYDELDVIGFDSWSSYFDNKNLHEFCRKYGFDDRLVPKSMVPRHDSKQGFLF